MKENASLAIAIVLLSSHALSMPEKKVHFHPFTDLQIMQMKPSRKTLISPDGKFKCEIQCEKAEECDIRLSKADSASSEKRPSPKPLERSSIRSVMWNPVQPHQLLFSSDSAYGDGTVSKWEGKGIGEISLDSRKPQPTNREWIIIGLSKDGKSLFCHYRYSLKNRNNNGIMENRIFKIN